ncbi:YajQ family cyclic di-GMP-binding protein [Veillonella caviae]|uniref:YajQ family cyclic di-GMP-binding protein n=1 Tax=Veillonella caviae TaxID=248316 RepID=UPI000F8E3605|nr:YajQ family cyclic di-GMP-binding protein [Veillonella caviae]MCF0158831.1 YajQ family cyclic di-GMP-binding protein [Veillonella sp.]MCI5708261.1 YajQ family cyclic di-GMP-binding protein [Veillonella caviae]MCI6406814.1 YajQ family cyclic di-GMP-binding protein [Veillonella caviae]MCI7694135.1 YajQ family cyclic di-GMP-binding protein [Veillonella caviae]MDD7290510.1 YajQ family cyclic di-GMP-binding protein [Veillonella caviae]
MAKDCSFDVVSEVDMQEVDNAVNQAKKEIGTRYDFRGSKAEINLEGDTIKIIGDDEYKLNAIIDVLKGKMVKRNVAVKNLDYGKVEPASGATVRQVITIKKGITKENAKEVVKAIKNMKLKVQASIQEDQVRVSGKDKDDLQAVIQMLKQLDVPVELQFVNFRS